METDQFRKENLHRSNSRDGSAKMSNGITQQVNGSIKNEDVLVEPRPVQTGDLPHRTGRPRPIALVESSSEDSDEDDDDLPMKRRIMLKNRDNTVNALNSSDNNVNLRVSSAIKLNGLKNGDEMMNDRDNGESGTKLLSRVPSNSYSTTADSGKDTLIKHESSASLSAKSPLSSDRSTIEQESRNSLTGTSTRDAAQVKQGHVNHAVTSIKNEESSDDEVPLIVRKKRTKISHRTMTIMKEESSDDDEKPLIKKTKITKVATEVKVEKALAPEANLKKLAKESLKATKSEKKKSGVKEEDEAESEEYKWWLSHQGDDTGPKWTTLEHNGVMFPPPYEPLPKNVKMKYDGRPIVLPLEAEEVAGFFGAMLETDHAKNPVFQKNFFMDFSEICKRNGITPPIESFEKCDFRPMYEYFLEQREKKKNMSKEEKKLIKEKKEKEEASFRTCLLDGREEKVGNFRIEPPGLFRGRGSHPKTGRLKLRVQPEQITINIGTGAKVPEPPAGHKWGDVRRDNTVTWLATWNENINNNVKYVFLAAGSSIKGQSDYKKYEKSRLLKSHIDTIRKNYREDMKHHVMELRQRATALYLIDVFALRAGNEKGDDEADTVGCCSLRYEHITLSPPRTVVFDFLGKDSIRYYNEVQVDHQAFKNLKIFKRPPKGEEDLIFDRLTTTKLNQHLSSLMPGLSAKVFRTFNASFTMARELNKATPKEGTVQEKILAYNRANRLVAILCNHQKSVSKAHDAQMERFEDRIRAIKFQLRRVRLGLLQLEPSLNKSMTELLEEESDLEEEWMEMHEDHLLAKEKEKIEKRFERDNEKLKEEKKPMLTKDLLKERLLRCNGMKEQIQKERTYRKKNIAKVELNPRWTVDKLKVQYEKLKDRLKASKMQKIDKDENKTTALSTSKINYIDPRITVAWCRKNNVPVEKMFTKTMREKFSWAMEVDKKWKW